MLRSCNVTRARLYEDSTEETWIRWYITAPNAPAYPDAHAFGHPVWEWDRNNFSGAGVFYDGLEWRPNKYPAAPTDFTPIGDLLDFRFGLVHPPIERPLCGGEGIEAQGGARVCGSGWKLPIVGGGVPGLAEPVQVVYQVASSVAGGAFTSSLHPFEPALRPILAGGHPALSSEPFPSYALAASVAGGAVTSSARVFSGGAYSDAYSDAWDVGP